LQPSNRDGPMPEDKKPDLIREFNERYMAAHAKLDAAMKEIQAQTDRGAAIIASSLIENSLRDALVARFLPLNNEFRDNMFGSRGFLGSFAAKIDMGLAVGLYQRPAHRDLTQIRRVRNEFAHNIEPLSFESPGVKKLCDRILLDLPFRDTRQRFLSAFYSLFAHLTDMEISPLTRMQGAIHPRDIPMPGPRISMTPVLLPIGADGTVGVEPEAAPTPAGEEPSQ
jgi:hypothetical protein